MAPMKNANPNVNLRPEHRLLLQAARTEAPQFAHIAAEVSTDVDFDPRFFLSEVSRHNVSGLVYESLSGILSAETAAVRSVIGHLRKMAFAGATRSIFLASELASLVRRMDENNIRTIPYKGPVLAEESYGNLGLRSFYDLDLLVREDQLPRATELLLDTGYELVSPAPGESLTSYMAREKEFKFRHTARPVSVELHWRLARKHLSFHLDFDDLFDAAGRVTIGSTEMPSLSPSDLILVLCANGCKDRWRRLSLLCDVSETLRSCSDDDLHLALDKSITAGARRILLLGFHLANKLLEAPVASNVQDLIEKDRVVRLLADKVDRWLWSSGGVSGHHGIEKAAFNVYVRENLRDRIPYVRHIARETLNPTARDRRSLGRFGTIRPLAYLARPLRLARGVLAGSRTTRETGD